MEKLRSTLKFITRSRSLFLGSIGFLVIVCIIIIAPFLLRTDPLTMDYGSILQPPSKDFLLGTDDLGRDLLARIIYGGQASMMIGLQVMLLTAIFGTFIGLTTGYFQGLDMLVMRFMDILMSFPSLLLAIAVLAAMGNNPVGVVIALSVVYTPRTARVIRSAVLSLREEMYVESAKAVGARTGRILLTYILPGVVPALVVQETFLFAYAILGEAGLSFVGVGIQPPTPSWGNILGDARVLIREAPWLLFSPGLAIMLTVLSLNLVGDGLREALDPKRRKLPTM